MSKRKGKRKGRRGRRKRFSGVSLVSKSVPDNPKDKEKIRPDTEARIIQTHRPAPPRPYDPWRSETLRPKRPLYDER